MAKPTYHLRPAETSDRAFLREVLYLALYVPPDGQPFPRSVLNDPNVHRYIDSWGRPGDWGVVAEADDGNPLGAAYIRTWTGPERGYGFVAPEIPELTIAVAFNVRNKGLGTQLLEALFAHTDPLYPGLSLNVNASSHAVRLYERLGFVPIAREEDTITMLRPSGGIQSHHEPEKEN